MDLSNLDVRVRALAYSRTDPVLKVSLIYCCGLGSALIRGRLGPLTHSVVVLHIPQFKVP